LTGFTLNHAGQIESKPKVESRDAQLPLELLEKLQQAQKQGAQAASKDAVGLPAEVDGWLAQQIKVSAKGFAVEWSEDEAYVPMPRPGGDAWLRVDLKEGSVEYEKTDRAGSPTSTTCTRGAIRAEPGACSSMSLRLAVWCSASRVC
jgi:hypothetical protein